MIIDCIIFNNEIDLFKIRYAELNGVVDHFIVLEATHSHSGNSKELIFTNATELHHDNVTVVAWDNAGYPNTHEGAWFRENMQRELLLDVLKDYSDDTYIILSDADEIPSREAVQRAKDTLVIPQRKEVWSFSQTLSYLFFNATAGGWGGSKITPLSIPRESTIARPMTNAIRYRPQDQMGGSFENGGWHFSSCFGVEGVKHKLRNFAHTECAVIADSGGVEYAYENLVDPFNHSKLTIVSTDTLPQYVQDNLDYFIARGYIYVD